MTESSCVCVIVCDWCSKIIFFPKSDDHNSITRSMSLKQAGQNMFIFFSLFDFWLNRFLIPKNATDSVKISRALESWLLTHFLKFPRIIKDNFHENMRPSYQYFRRRMVREHGQISRVSVWCLLKLKVLILFILHLTDFRFCFKNFRLSSSTFILAQLSIFFSFVSLIWRLLSRVMHHICTKSHWVVFYVATLQTSIYFLILDCVLWM